MHVIFFSTKRAVSWKKNRGGVGRFGGRKGSQKGCNYNLQMKIKQSY